MRRTGSTYIILAALLLHTGIYAQQQDVPIVATSGIENVFIRTIDDTARTMGYIRAGDALKNKLPDSAKQLFGNALQESQRINFPDGIADALIGIGCCYIQQGKYEESIAFFKQAYPYAQNALFERERIMMLLYNNMAIPYNYEGKFEQALYYHYKAVQQVINNPRMLLKYASRPALTFNNIGVTFGKNGQYDKALYYFEKGIIIAKATKSYEFIGGFYINMASAYGSLKNWSMHDSLAQLALRWSIKMHDTRTLQGIYCEMGDGYVDRHMPGKAIPYYQKALTITDEVNPYDGLLSTYKGIGVAYYQSRQYVLAEHYLNLAIQAAQMLHVQDQLLIDVHHTLSATYQAENKYQLALQHQNAYIQLSDSLLNEKRNKTINQLEIQYRTAEKDKNIARQELVISQTENQLKDKNLWISIISAIAILLAIILTGRYRNNKKQAQINKLKAQMDGEEHERARIGRELHDGIMVQFSAVKMRLSTLINKNKYIEGIDEFKDTMQLLDGATKELRRTAHNLMPDTLLEEGLAEAVFFFCKNLQKNTDLNISFQTYGSIPRLDPSLELSLYRTIQELVHNIIKHAQATQAIVQLSGQDGLLMINVEDNGVGISEAMLHAHNGIGIKNIQNRIATLKGKMDIQSKPGQGTAIYIEFNIGSMNKKFATT